MEYRNNYPGQAPRGSLAVVGEGLRMLARFLDETAASASVPAVAPDVPGVDYGELNYKNLKEAAKALGMSVDKLYNIVYREDFPAFKVGDRWYIPKAELAEWNARMAKEKAEI